ncbi:hypothetical protein MVEN_01142000 [Mycena venus]|uniref:Uncharacterized protein n=1 Tax=Mycena venus TaxID=2733690 RepID=A0A8H6Y0K0_9AGAR|nr:hypothetical protein MVEN_01142000 [Mycena venus]
MSLLHNVLKWNQQTGHPDVSGDFPLPITSKRSVKHYAESIKSSDGPSMKLLAEPILGFYNIITGGETHVPKRRHADISKLGKFDWVPEWYAGNPPYPPLMPGTAAASSVPGFTSGTASVLHPDNEVDKPWLGLVLYSHARPESTMPMYHNAGKVTGEVRVVLDEPTNLGSIDVWVVIASDSAADDFKPPIAALTVNVWNRKKGDPRSTTPDGHLFAGDFPAGRFVFPFEFPALPEDTLVKHPDNTQRKNHARVPLPPSYHVSMVSGFWGIVKYIAGVNIMREGLGAIDDEFDMEFQYLPLCKSLPRIKAPFPHILAREDWPFHREVVGGWTLTPFGGRGHLGDELVEVEGILGIQEPAVYTAGQTLEFSLLLWSTNPRALEALGQPGAVEVGLYKADIFSENVLDPRTASRQDRYTTKLAEGRVWRTDDERPADDAPIPAVQMVTLPHTPANGAGHKNKSYHVRGVLPAHMDAIYAAQDEDDDTTLAEHSEVALKLGGKSKDVSSGHDDHTHRALSPKLSLEDLHAEESHLTDHFVRLDGEVRVPACSPPSFRYTHMGREYILDLLIRHPQYAHISPNATGLLAECPIWFVIDRFANLPPSASHDLAALPLSGVAIAVGPDAVRAALSVGTYTEERRPTTKFGRRW